MCLFFSTNYQLLTTHYKLLENLDTDVFFGSITPEEGFYFRHYLVRSHLGLDEVTISPNFKSIFDDFFLT